MEMINKEERRENSNLRRRDENRIFSFDNRNESKNCDKSKRKEKTKISNIPLESDTIKRKKNNTFRYIIQSKSYINTFKILLLINIFMQIISKDLFFLNKNSKITLYIKGTGKKNILNANFLNDYTPDNIIINGESKKPITHNYNFTQPNNTVEIVWVCLIKQSQNMFHNCLDITNIFFNKFDTSEFTYMGGMFQGCSSLTSLDLSKFDTSKVKSMANMFMGCKLLTYLDLSNFDTSYVTNMGHMFANCSLLTSLNLSNFNTSKITYMDNMFIGCQLLTSLNLSNFNTSDVIYMGYMFADCSSLISLNLSNFHTSKVQYMDNMFNGCKLLTSLNLSNFDTSEVININNMFKNCDNLEYINMKNFNEIKLQEYQDIFYNTPENIIICLDEKRTTNKILSQLQKKSCYIIDCSDNIILNQNKQIDITSICTDINDNYIKYKYVYNGMSYENCVNGYLINNSTINSCNCNKEQCFSCPQKALRDNSCVKYNLNFDNMENNIHIDENYVNCCEKPYG